MKNRKKRAVLVSERQTSIFEIEGAFAPTNWIEALMVAGLTIEGSMKMIDETEKKRRVSAFMTTKRAEWISDFLVADKVKVFRAGFVSAMGRFGMGMKAVKVKAVKVPRRKHSYNISQAYLDFAKASYARVTGKA